MYFGPGELVTPDSDVYDVGELAAGAHRTISVQLRNTGSAETRLFGAETDCSCTVVDALPGSIPAGGTVSIPIEISGAGEGDFSRKIEFHYGASVLRTATVAIRGTTTVSPTKE